MIATGEHMRTIALVSIVLTFALFGCTKTETSGTATTSTTATTATVATAAPTTATTATVATAPPVGGAIASTEGEKSGARIDVTELKRTSGGTVNLKFTITNGGTGTMGTRGSYFGDHAVSADDYSDVSGIHLVDPVNKKKYFVVVDSDRKCLCSKELPDIKAGEKINVWAKFPAPPAEVSKVTIEIPHFQPMDDVTISQ
jgi:hypothetical protein